MMNILITGGASGLGEVITKKLASEPTNVVYFTYFKSEVNAAELEKKFPNTKAIKCDFNNSEDIDLLISKMDSLNLNVLINNAITQFEIKHFHKLEPNCFIESFNSNIIPTIKISQKAISIFRKAKFGKIITILSSAIISTPPIGWAEYTANKAYLLSLSKSWAVENANFNITSNCISPEFLQTPLTRNTDERVIEEMIKSHPLKKLLTKEEVADTISFLVGAPQHISGINLVMNSAVNIS